MGGSRCEIRRAGFYDCTSLRLEWLPRLVDRGGDLYSMDGIGGCTDHESGVEFECRRIGDRGRAARRTGHGWDAFDGVGAACDVGVELHRRSASQRHGRVGIGYYQCGVQELGLYERLDSWGAATDARPGVLDQRVHDQPLDRQLHTSLHQRLRPARLGHDLDHRRNPRPGPAGLSVPPAHARDEHRHPSTSRRRLIVHHLGRSIAAIRDMVQVALRLDSIHVHRQCLGHPRLLDRFDDKHHVDGNLFPGVELTRSCVSISLY